MMEVTRDIKIVIEQCQNGYLLTCSGGLTYGERFVFQALKDIDLEKIKKEHEEKYMKPGVDPGLISGLSEYKTNCGTGIPLNGQGVKS